MQVTHYLHTAILVSDLEKAEYFYGAVLELPKVDRQLKYPGAWYQLGETQIHLIVDSTISSGLHNLEKWGRNRHVALAVDSLQSVKEHLQAHGLEVQVSASGRAALFTHDPDGNVIELTEVH